MTDSRSVSFIVPCFNEEENVHATVASIHEAMGGGEYEIILINDCSLDRTLQRMQTLSHSDTRVRIIDNPINLGLGGSYKRGLPEARCIHVIMVPGDNGFPAPSI